MNTTLRALPALAALAALAILAYVVGCAGMAPVLDSSDLDVGPLCDQHDTWVVRDIALGEDAQDEALAESEALLALIEAVDQLPQDTFAAALRPVVERYDAYLAGAWATLLPLQRRYLSRTSDLAREVAGLPLTPWPPFGDGQ